MSDEERQERQFRGPLCDCLAAPSPHRHGEAVGTLFIEPATAPGHAGLDHCDECGWTR